ncbi:hypothetical protein HMPREF0262_02202 [Clostridium sp. ATCC 29733]|nr:hypothetical protein HMPREF0262_02202 [Clostridium sp. ATCC 29733]
MRRFSSCQAASSEWPLKGGFVCLDHILYLKICQHVNKIFSLFN